MAKGWMGIYADDGGINVKGRMDANSIDLSADKNCLNAGGIYSDTYVKGYLNYGDINISGDVKAADGLIDLITDGGGITTENIEAKEDINVCAYLFGDLNIRHFKIF